MKLTREIPLLMIIAIPFILLGYWWSSLPAEVPLHWNFSGEPDRFGSKNRLWLIPILLPLLTYIVMTAIPIIDPRKKVKQDTNKYQNLRFILIGVMSMLSCVIIYSARQAGSDLNSLVFLCLGITFVLLGNYLPTIQPNYFIGIRSPWALENDQVWKKTHQLGGKLFFAGGILIIVISLLVSGSMQITLLISISLMIAVIPIVYSYLLFQKEKTNV